MCPTCLDEGVVCEAHPEVPWPHDSCVGPARPCPACQENAARPEGYLAVVRIADPLWELRKDGRTYTCKLHYRGEHVVEARISRNGSALIGHRFATRPEALQWAMKRHAELRQHRVH